MGVKLDRVSVHPRQDGVGKSHQDGTTLLRMWSGYRGKESKRISLGHETKRSYEKEKSV